MLFWTWGDRIRYGPFHSPNGIDTEHKTPGRRRESWIKNQSECGLTATPPFRINRAGVRLDTTDAITANMQATL